MLRVNQVKLKTGHSEADLRRQTASILRVPEQNITELRIVRQSIDARKKPVIFYSYSMDVAVRDEEKILHRFRGKENLVCRSCRRQRQMCIRDRFRRNIVSRHPGAGRENPL